MFCIALVLLLQCLFGSCGYTFKGETLSGEFLFLSLVSHISAHFLHAQLTTFPGRNLALWTDHFSKNFLLTYLAVSTPNSTTTTTHFFLPEHAHRHLFY